MLTLWDSAITRELPDHYPFTVSNDYIKSIIEEWSTPAQVLFDQIQHVLMNHVKKIVAVHFSKFAHGNLQHHVTYVCLFLTRDYNGDVQSYVELSSRNTSKTVVAKPSNNFNGCKSSKDGLAR